MAKTKAAGSTRLGRDSIAKRLGVKLFAGQKARAGMVILRQRGTRFIPGKNVGRAGDDTLYALKEGIIVFRKIRKRRFDNAQRVANVVSIE